MPRMAEAPERRAQILRAAVAVFSERGYPNATISAIASAAGVGHGTIYLYFRSKSEIFASLVNWFSDHIVEGVTQSACADRSDPASLRIILHQIIYRALAASAGYPKLAEICLRSSHDSPADLAQPLERLASALAECIAQRLAAGIRAGTVRPINPREGADLILSVIGIAIEQLLRLGPDADLDRLTTWYVDFLLFGLTGAPVDSAGEMRNFPDEPSVSQHGNLERV